MPWVSSWSQLGFNLANLLPNLAQLATILPPIVAQLGFHFGPTRLQLDQWTKDANRPKMQIDQRCKFTKNAQVHTQRSKYEGGGAGVTPRGRLRYIRGPRRGAAVLDHVQILTKSCKICNFANTLGPRVIPDGATERNCQRCFFLVVGLWTL